MADRPQAAGGEPAPHDEEALRAAYEEQLRTLTSADLLMQSAASLVNLAARRLGLASEDSAERDLEQARDAIDGVRGLMPVLERRLAGAQMRPLQDALAQLQLAYARQAQGGERPGTPESGDQPARARGAGEAAGQAPGQGPGPGGGGAAAGGEGSPSGAGAPGDAAGEGAPQQHPGARPGPAESSGRLWVPGRR
jgi:hypothetical protein